MTHSSFTPPPSASAHGGHTPAPVPPASRGAVRTLGASLTAVSLACICLSATLFTTRKAALASERRARIAEQAEGQRVLAGSVTASPNSRTVTLPGDVHPWRTATLYAKLPGYLRSIAVDRGDRVLVHQLLGTIESPETDQQLRAAQADVALKQKTHTRFLSLIERGVVSHQELDMAAAQLHEAEAEVHRLEALKTYEQLRAPYAGAITARYVDAGALLPAATSSTQSAQPLVDIQDDSRVRVFVYVGQADAPFVAVGDAVHLSSRERHEVVLDATVTRVAHALDPRTRTMLVEVDVDNPSLLLQPGTFIQASLQLAVPSMPQVPAEAVFIRKGITYVAAIDKQNVAHFTRVKLGQSDGKQVQVLEGLEPGQSVGLHIGDDVLDGTRVRPIEPKHTKVPPGEHGDSH